MGTHSLIPDKPFTHSLLSKPKSVKDAILFSLMEKWPLKANQINDTVKKMDFAVTPQAIHKSLQEMTESGQLERDGTQYMIKKSWVTRQKQLFFELEKRLNENTGPDFNQWKNDNYMECTMDISDAALFLAELFTENYFSKDPNSPICSYFHHMFFPPNFEVSDFETVQKLFIKRPNGVICCKGTTPFDQFIAEMYLKADKITGEQVYLGVDLGWTDEIFIDGDTLIQSSMDLKSQLILDKLYQQCGGLDDLAVHMAKVGTKTKILIKLQFIKNAFLAETLRNQLLEAAKRVKK